MPNDVSFQVRSYIWLIRYLLNWTITYVVYRIFFGLPEKSKFSLGRYNGSFIGWLLISGVGGASWRRIIDLLWSIIKFYDMVEKLFIIIVLWHLRNVLICKINNERVIKSWVFFLMALSYGRSLKENILQKMKWNFDLF